MSAKTKTSRSFRAWEDTEKRLNWAEQLGVNVSELVNQVLADHLKPYLEKAAAERAEAMKTALAKPPK